MEFSEHGNSHYTGFDEIHVPKGEMGISDDHKIELLLTAPVSTNTPYYISTHTVDMRLLRSTFLKHIRITYDEQDIDNLLKVYFGKVCLDVFDRSIEESIEKTTRFEKYLKKYASFFKQEEMDDVLFLKWNDILYLNPVELVRILSEYTSIPEQQFNIDLLLSWRNKTTQCITKINSLYNEVKIHG